MQSSEDETWRPIPGWEGFYEVSDIGRVRSVARIVPYSSRGTRKVTPCLLRPFKAHAGRYYQVSLNRAGGKQTRYVHQLVLEAFVGPSEGLDGCHSDGDSTNNRLSNLRWDTRSSNILDAVQQRTHWQSRKMLCPRGHLLATPNLIAAGITKGNRSCLSCHRARSILRRNCDEQEWQELSDRYYAALDGGSILRGEAS